MTYSRTPIPLPELAADLNRLGQAATVVHNALIELLDGRLVPEGALPNLHAARRSAQALTTHLDGSRRLVEGA
jgi:hypothetical protein